MDGNGRWAAARGLTRDCGHREGAKAVERTVDAALEQGIGTLTLFAFSGDNWQRPATEVGTLLQVFENYLLNARHECARRAIRVSVIGRRHRLSLGLRAAAQAIELVTAQGTRMHLRIAIDYSGRDAILEAARSFAQSGAPARELTRRAFSRLISEHAGNESAPVPDVDLLIRTGGEQRLSDCLLWEIAYAEIVFTGCMWPDFDAADLESALREYHGRERRYGRIVSAAVANSEMVSPDHCETR
jgi:undecaprenyl diphosphate synthase